MAGLTYYVYYEQREVLEGNCCDRGLDGGVVDASVVEQGLGHRRAQWPIARNTDSEEHAVTVGLILERVCGEGATGRKTGKSCDGNCDWERHVVRADCLKYRGVEEDEGGGSAMEIWDMMSCPL